ncbi:MAG: DUF5320 domain-containing protein [Candidatus Bathyarchaeota archaeon]
MCYELYNRRFLNKAEKITLLKEYKESLENELKGAEERVKELEEVQK